jgi:hypothetical protein
LYVIGSLYDTGVVVLVAVMVYVPNLNCLRGETVSVGSLAIVIVKIKVQLLASIICAYQVVLVVGSKLAVLVPYAPGVAGTKMNTYNLVHSATVTVTLAVGITICVDGGIACR